MYNNKSESSYKLRTLGTDDVSVQFIRCNTLTTLVEGVDKCRRLYKLETGVYGKSLYLPVSFIVNFKVL